MGRKIVGVVAGVEFVVMGLCVYRAESQVGVGFKPKVRGMIRGWGSLVSESGADG
jgi:hypothetical protein